MCAVRTPSQNKFYFAGAASVRRRTAANQADQFWFNEHLFHCFLKEIELANPRSAPGVNCIAVGGAVGAGARADSLETCTMDNRAAVGKQVAPPWAMDISAESQTAATSASRAHKRTP